MQQFGVGFVFGDVVFVFDRCGQYRVAEFLHKGAHNVVVGHANAYCFAIFEQSWQVVAAVEYECECAGQVVFQQSERAVVHFGVFADVAQVVADDG